MSRRRYKPKAQRRVAPQRLHATLGAHLATLRPSAYRDGFADVLAEALDSRRTTHGDLHAEAELAELERMDIHDPRCINARDYLLGRYAAGMMAAERL